MQQILSARCALSEMAAVFFWLFGLSHTKTDPKSLAMFISCVSCEVSAALTKISASTSQGYFVVAVVHIPRPDYIHLLCY